MRVTPCMANLDSAENMSHFGTDERAASVRGIDVKPDRLAVANQSDLF